MIHASAVGDYKPEFSFRMEDLAKELLELDNEVEIPLNTNFNEIFNIELN